MERELHPLELREYVVRQVELCRRRGCRTRRRAAPGTARARRSPPRSPRPAAAARRRRARARRARSACGRRSRGTRSRGREQPRPSRATDALPSDHVVWQWRSPRISRLLHERRRLAAERRLAQLGRARTGGRAVRTRCSSVRRLGQRLERLDVRRATRSPGRARCRSCSGRGDDELDRDALDGDADRVPLLALDDGDDLGLATSNRSSASGAVETSASRGRARTSAAALPRPRRRARAAIAAASARARLAGQPAPRRLRLPRDERREDLRLGRRADSRRLPQAAGLRRRAQLVRRADAEGAPERRRAAAGPSRGSGPARPARARPRARAPRARRSVPSRRARAGAARCRGRFRAARAPGPCARVARRAPASSRIELGGPPVRAHARVRRAGEVEQRRVGIEGAGDLGVVHAG